jgi:hypothetical protein
VRRLLCFPTKVESGSKGPPSTLDTLSVMGTVPGVKSRLVSLLSLLLVLAVSLGALEIVELQMSRGVKHPGKLTQIDPGPSDRDIFASTTAVKADLAFDPVTEVVDPFLWQRENKFHMLDHAHRVGWGPDLVEQLPRPRPLDPVRVLVVGDSFVWGQGVEDLDERWDKVLQQELDLRSYRGAFEVIPIGRGAASTMNIAEWLTEERIAKHDPDAFVLGFITNDYWPTFTEQHFCKKLNLCAADGASPLADCGPRCDIAACLLGEGTPFGWMLRNVMNPAYPNVTSWLLKRYCDPDRIAARRGLLSERSFVDNPQETTYWPLFLEAVEHLGKVGGDMPRYLMHTRTRDFIVDALDPAEKVFMDNGFELIEENSSHDVISRYSAEQLSVNPADPHPNSLLTHAYAADTAKVLIERFAESLRPDHTSPKAAAPLVSNYSPSSLYTRNVTPTTTELTYDHDSVKRQGFWVAAEVNGRTFPQQTAPCARMGRPHARVMLDRFVGEGSVVRLSLRSSENMVVLPVGTTRDGTPVTGTPFALPADGSRDLVVEPGIKGFLLGVTRDGCDPQGELFLPVFKLSMQLLPKNT